MKHQEEYKKFCIEQHRKMWHWIAAQYRKGRKADVADLKNEYVVKFISRESLPYCNCFCCDYALETAGFKIKNNKASIRCSACPLVWGGEEKNTCSEKEYGDIAYGTNSFMCRQNWDNALFLEYTELAEQIANLPERMGV